MEEYYGRGWVWVKVCVVDAALGGARKGRTRQDWFDLSVNC